MSHDDEVVRKAANPENDDYVSLLVTFDTRRREIVAEHIPKISGYETHNQIAPDIFHVIVSHSDKEEIRSIDGVDSVEKEGKLKTLSSGN